MNISALIWEEKMRQVAEALACKAQETAYQHTTGQYIWRAQDDGKVRPEHAVNNGKIFSWDDPPSTGNPGEAYGCRCWAEPYGEDKNVEAVSVS